MRYHDPQLAERLAAEYVLGTLRGRARRRFEGLLGAHPRLRKHVREWEQRLQESLQPAPVEPPPQIWPALARRLFGTAQAERQPWYRRLGFWRALSLGSGVAAAALALVLLVQFNRPTTSWAGVLSDVQTGQPMWLISANDDMRLLRIKAMKTMQLQPRQACLLWVKPAGDERPYLVGRLPDQGELRMEVKKSMLPKMSGVLLVTVEEIDQGMPEQPRVAPRFQGEWVSVKPI